MCGKNKSSVASAAAFTSPISPTGDVGAFSRGAAASADVASKQPQSIPASGCGSRHILAVASDLFFCVAPQPSRVRAYVCAAQSALGGLAAG